MRVRPKNPDAIIRDPHTRRPLPTEGGRVSDSSYWRRRIADGDVELVAEEGGDPVPPEHAPVPPLATRGGSR
jgi:hypothetical protein